jgi:hypothetical protein
VVGPHPVRQTPFRATRFAEKFGDLLGVLHLCLSRWVRSIDILRQERAGSKSGHHQEQEGWESGVQHKADALQTKAPLVRPGADEADCRGEMKHE